MYDDLMKRLTISVPDDVVDKAQRAVDAGEAPSVSAFFADIAEREPDWAAGRAVLNAMITEIGGLTEAEISAAEKRLGLAQPAWATA
jgi:hypothetical protein